MSNISILTQNLLSTLSNDERKYFELSKHGKVSQIEENTVYQSLLRTIKSVHAKSGQIQNVEDSDFTLMASMLSNEVLKRYPNATLLEITEAMNNGVIKVYGVYYGLNLVTFMDWIAAFYADEKRKDALLKANKLLAQRAETPKTPEELKQIAEDSIKVMIDHFKATGEVLNVGNSNFHYLWKMGKIKFDAKKAEQYKSQAEKNIYSRLNAERSLELSRGNRDEVRKIDVKIEALMDEDSQIRIEAGTLALIDWMVGSV